MLRRISTWLQPRSDADALVAHAAGLTLLQVFRRFWPRLRPLRPWLALALLLLAVAPLIEVAEVMLFQRLVDDVLVPADAGPLMWLALAYLGLNVASGVVSGLDDYLGTWIAQRFLVPLRREVFEHVLALPARVQDRNRLGDVLTRLTTDVATLERFMVSQLVNGIGALLRLVVLVGALLWLQWELALAALVTAPLLWLVSLGFARFAKIASDRKSVV